MSQSFTTYTTQQTVSNNFPFHISRAQVTAEKEDFVSLVSKVHSHEYMQILYVNQGKITNQIEEHSEEVDQGELIFLPPFAKHSNTYFEGADVYTLSFLPSLLDDSFENPFQLLESNKLTSQYFTPFTESMKDHQLVRKLSFSPRDKVLLQKLVPALLGAYQEENQLRVHADFCKVLQIIAEAYSYARQKGDESQQHTPNPHYEKMQEILQHIHENYQETLTAERMIEEAEMSATYFRVIFKELTGKSFVQYLNELRVFHAIDLMKNQKMPLKEIAFEVGFSDFQNFHRSFKKIIACSPSQFMKLEQG